MLLDWTERFQGTAMLPRHVRDRLINVALKEGEPATVKEIADAYNISINHLKKAAIDLNKQGYLKTIQGRYGGYILQRNQKLS